MKWLRLVECRYYTDLYTGIVNRSVTKLGALVRTAVHFCNKTANNKLYSLEQPVQANSWRLHQPQCPRHEQNKILWKKTVFSPFPDWVLTPISCFLKRWSSECSLFRPLLLSRWGPHRVPPLEESTTQLKRLEDGEVQERTVTSHAGDHVRGTSK